jgi:hypothetical protein
MFLPMKWTVAATLAGLTILGAGVPHAQAQFRQRTLPVYSPGVSPLVPFYNPLTPNYRVAPGVSMQQAIFNNYQVARAAASLPPWMYGYNPYPAPIVSTGPVVPYPVASYYSPYSNPYTSYSYTPWLYTTPIYSNPYVFSTTPY